MVGTKKGVSWSSLYGIDNPGDSEKTALAGFNGGLFVEVALSHRFSLQGELLFNRRGLKEEGDYDYSWVASYIDIPLLAKMNFSFVRDFIQTSLYLGPQFSFSLAGSFFSDEQVTGEDVETKARPFDLGLAVGAEGGVRLPPFDLFVDLRYVLGFLTVADPDDTQGQWPRNAAFSVLFGLGYTL